MFGVVFLATLVLLWGLGSRDKMFEGTLQWGFEKSDFHLNGNCSATPYWYDSSKNPTVNLHDRWVELGKLEAMWVKFRGDLSSLGRYGHLGKYWREIRPATVIEVKPATACKE